MAIVTGCHLSAFPSVCTSTKLPPKTRSSHHYSSSSLGQPSNRNHHRRPVCCGGGAVASMVSNDQTITRRSANYQSSMWHYDYIQSLTSQFAEESHKKRIHKLKEEVRMMLERPMNPLHRLELIDTLQRLGVAYHFEDEIKRILAGIYSDNHHTNSRRTNENLYATALEFRLLRQHGYEVSQEIFNSFRDDAGNFKERLCGDIQGMLSLYEASYHLEEGESMLEDARDFAATHLTENVKDKEFQFDSLLARHALELPLHWRVPRLEARWFIDMYEKKQGMSPLLLEFAKVDFNIVQAVHQEDLKHASRWWTKTGLGEKLSFARDRIMENFLWTVGMRFEPQFGYFRRISAAVFALITTIDDIYDVYGTLDELELFTDAVERWDVTAMDQLPEYMKMCYLSLLNLINEIAYDALKEQGVHIIPCLKKAWKDLCKSYLLEAKWYYNGYKPTLQEYLDNACISISTPVILAHGYFSIVSPITNTAMKALAGHPNIIRWSSIILRLANDLGTSSDELKRGDVPKSIHCYMRETGAYEEEARSHIRYLISETWKKMNKEQAIEDSPFPEPFKVIAMNLGRMAQCMYQYGDGHGVVDCETKDRVLTLLVHPMRV